MTNPRTKHELTKWRLNQRKAKERKRMERGESELSQELRWRKDKPLGEGDKDALELLAHDP